MLLKYSLVSHSDERAYSTAAALSLICCRQIFLRNLVLTDTATKLFYFCKTVDTHAVLRPLHLGLYALYMRSVQVLVLLSFVDLMLVLQR